MRRQILTITIILSMATLDIRSQNVSSLFEHMYKDEDQEQWDKLLNEKKSDFYINKYKTHLMIKGSSFQIRSYGLNNGNRLFIVVGNAGYKFEGLMISYTPEYHQEQELNAVTYQNTEFSDEIRIYLLSAKTNKYTKIDYSDFARQYITKIKDTRIDSLIKQSYNKRLNCSYNIRHGLPLDGKYYQANHIEGTIYCQDGSGREVRTNTIINSYIWKNDMFILHSSVPYK